jgi:hypothetical protein
MKTDAAHSFAFVEYESRRDADDAYHEMHNKRIGRDDVLKIEASSISGSTIQAVSNGHCSGLARRHLQAGASMPAALRAESAPHAVALARHHAAVAMMMIVVTETMIEIGTTIVTALIAASDVSVIAPAAQKIATAT